MIAGQGREAWANSLRGIAAAAVMLGHLVGATVLLQAWVGETVGFPPGPQLTDPFGLAHLLAAGGLDLMGAGVCLFFLLSGYVIARSLRHYTRSGFLVGRLLRLLPTYAAGYLLIVTVVCGVALSLGRQLPVGPAELTGLIPGLPELLGVEVVPNPVAWTLVVEITFYGICLVLYRGLLDRTWVLISVTLGCVVAQGGLLAVTVPEVLSGARDLLLVALPFLPILLIGVLLDGLRHRPFDWHMLWPVVVLIAAFLWMTRHRLFWPFSPLGVEGAGVGYQLTFVGTVAVFIVIWHRASDRMDGSVVRWLADISYPLYVVHAMVGWAVIFALVRWGVPQLVAEASAITVVLAAAWFLHVIVEAPSHRLGQRLARRLSDPDRQLRPSINR